MKKLALIDLDGTLFDTSKANWLAYSDVLKEFEIEIDYEYFKEKCNGRYYKNFISEIKALNEAEFDYIHKRKKENYNLHLKEVKKNEHLFSILNAIKDSYYLVIVTTASKENAYSVLRHFNVLDLFDRVLTQEDVKNKKPNPEGFLKAINMYNVEINNIIIFEDSPEGIEAANKTGASVFVVNKF